MIFGDCTTNIIPTAPEGESWASKLRMISGRPLDEANPILDTELVFAFCIFTGYLFYVQFLVIWYGNLPEETRYVILRVKLTPWEPVAGRPL
jgi:type IV secretory pathway ATPase VirB11/archaellum biosynthesis ATPase